MGKHGATKKEINRIKKKDLIKLLKSEGIEVSKKMSKRELVGKAFKHKKLRMSLDIPPKRKMSEKQKTNLNKYKLGGKNQVDFKNEKLIKPKSAYLAELSKIEDVELSAVKSKNQGSKIKSENKTDGKLDSVRTRELFTSTEKVDDEVVQAASAVLRKQTDMRLKIKENKAKNQVDVRFGEGAIVAEFDLSQLKDADGSLSISKIVNVKNQLLKTDPSNPLLNTILLLEQIAHREKTRQPVGKVKGKRVLEMDVGEEKKDDDDDDDEDDKLDEIQDFVKNFFLTTEGRPE